MSVVELLTKERDEYKTKAHELASAEGKALDLVDELKKEIAELRKLVDAVNEQNTSLCFRAAQSGVPLVDEPDMYGSRIEHYPLSRVLDLMNAWRSGAERWGLHQMCRVLRAEVGRLQSMLDEMIVRDAENSAVLEAKLRLAQEEFDCSDISRAHWEKAHDSAITAWVDDIRRLSEQYGAESERWTDRIWRACEAVPCLAGKPDGVGLGCHAPYYRHQPCCNLRVALWPGEAFEVIGSDRDGWLHLFKPSSRPGAVRISAGCIKLIEPTICERNELMDWDFKHRYLG